MSAKVGHRADRDGKGRTLFETVEDPVAPTLQRSRTFKNGDVVSWYELASKA